MLWTHHHTIHHRPSAGHPFQTLFLYILHHWENYNFFTLSRAIDVYSVGRSWTGERGRVRELAARGAIGKCN